MPCMENFAAQDAEYRDGVLPPQVRARVSLEAAATFGWHQWVGELGEAIGMHGFGASGSGGCSVQALWFHPRTGRRGRESGRQARALERTRLERRNHREHHHRAQSPVVSANRGGRERVARSDSPFDWCKGGELARMVAVESLRGVTSNPSIFEKAILGSTDYDEDLKTLARENLDSTAIYEQHRDPRRAARRRRARRCTPGSARTRRLRLARGGAGARAQHRGHARAGALVYWRRVDRPNVMIKIPGTPEGVPAIEQAIVRGNQRQRHAAVLGRCVREGG